MFYDVYQAEWFQIRSDGTPSDHVVQEEREDVLYEHSSTRDLRQIRPHSPHSARNRHGLRSR